jgi:hypothetical protein
MVMQRNCHEFIAYENLVSGGRRSSGDRGGRPQGPVGQQAPIDQVVPLVRRALKVLSDREVSPQLGLLKSTLLQLDSTFSERTYGVSSFRDFAQKLAAAGHVTLREAGRNVLVELAEGNGSAVAAEEAPRQPQPHGRREGDVQGRREAQEPQVAADMVPGEVRTADGIREVRRLFQSAQNPPRFPMYIRQAKQFLRNVDSTFDERKYGFASLVDLLRACQREGLFRIERDRQGVMRVFPGNVMHPDAEDTIVAPPAAPGAPRPWQPGDDIPDIHEADLPDTAAEVVEADVVREVAVPEVLDAQPAFEEPASADADAPLPRKPKSRGGRTRAKAHGDAKAEPRARKAAEGGAPRARKTGTSRSRSSRPRKTRDSGGEG